VIAALRYWPQALAFMLDEAARDPEVGPLVVAARNVAFVLRGIKNQNFDLDGALAASLDLPAGSSAETRLCATSRKVKRGGRDITICSTRHGAERVAWDVLPGGQRTIAVLPDDKALDWWLGLRHATPRKNPPELATMRIDLARLMAQAMKDQDPMVRAAVQMFAAGKTRAQGTIRPDGDLLRVDLRVDSAR